MAEEVMSTRGQGNQPQGRKRRLPTRSRVWEHFTRDVGNGTAKCKRCSKVYADHGTTNLWKHLHERCGGQESADAGISEQPPQPLLSLAQDDEAMQQQLSDPGESSGCEPHQVMQQEEAHYDQSTLHNDSEMPFSVVWQPTRASLQLSPSDLPPSPQQQPCLLPPPLPLGDPSRPNVSSDSNASVPLPQPCAPPPSLQKEASKHLARMIALHGHDASVVEDDCFRSFIRSLNPEFEVPSRVAIENMCDDVFDEAMRDLLNRWRRAPGKVNLAVGRAKTMDEKVVYLTCHFIDDGWNLHKLVLDAIVTTDHHDYCDGAILGLNVCSYRTDEDVTAFISRHDMYKKLFIAAYETTDDDKDILHAVKDKLSYNIGKFCDNSNSREILFTTYIDNVLHSIAGCLLPGKDFTATVLGDMVELHLTRQGRLELFAQLDLHYEWAYDEHWYACYCSLAVLCKKGFPRQHTHARLVITKLLCKLWEKTYRAIQKISSSTGPTANLCLAELFKLREILQTELERFSSADHGDIFNGGKVTCVLRYACDTLDNAIEDCYLPWSLPLALDPRYKLEFITFNFERAYGSEAAKEFVSKVTTMITELYADYAKEYGTTDGADHSDGASAMDTTTSADDTLEQAWNDRCRSQQGIMELDRYLKDRLAPQAEGFDILNWWKAHSSEYPMLARMARDALAMPTCRKLCSDQMAQLRSILRGYSNKPYGDSRFELEDFFSFCEGFLLGDDAEEVE